MCGILFHLINKRIWQTFGEVGGGVDKVCVVVSVGRAICKDEDEPYPGIQVLCDGV